jgi:hypothetical protein
MLFYIELSSTADTFPSSSASSLTTRLLRSSIVVERVAEAPDYSFKADLIPKLSLKCRSRILRKSCLLKFLKL